METAEEILKTIIDLFQDYLNQIESVKNKRNRFLYGEKTAYVECLEIIQRWEFAPVFGLNYDIEKKYPL